MNNFLNALKNKASEIETPKMRAVKIESTPVPSYEPVSENTHYEYFEAENRKVGKINFNLNEPAPVNEPRKLIITVDRVLNRNRLDIFFSDKPSEVILNSLKANGWRYRPSDRAWFHQDNEYNRGFCTVRLGADFMDSGDVEPSESFPAPQNETTELTPFDRYKMQVTELCEYLKLDSADMLLVAVDSLHKTTFSKDA